MKCAIILPMYPKRGFRYFCLDKEGDKHITGYSFEKDFVTDYYSFTRQMPAIVCTEAVKDSTVYQLSHEQLENFWEPELSKPVIRS